MSGPGRPDGGRGMRRTPLPAPPPPEADAIRIVEALLDKRELPLDLQARLADVEAAAERREREDR